MRRLLATLLGFIVILSGMTLLTLAAKLTHEGARGMTPFNWYTAITATLLGLAALAGLVLADSLLSDARQSRERWPRGVYECARKRDATPRSASRSSLSWSSPPSSSADMEVGMSRARV